MRVALVGDSHLTETSPRHLDEFASNCDRLISAASSWRRLVLGPGPVIERHVPGERTNSVVAAYADVLRRVSATHAARFVSMADVLDDVDLAEDGVHLDDSGYRKLASRVLVELGPSA